MGKISIITEMTKRLILDFMGPLLHGIAVKLKTEVSLNNPEIPRSVAAIIQLLLENNAKTPKTVAGKSGSDLATETNVPVDQRSAKASSQSLGFFNPTK